MLGLRGVEQGSENKEKGNPKFQSVQLELLSNLLKKQKQTELSSDFCECSYFLLNKQCSTEMAV